MAKNFASLAFTDEVKMFQEKFGSRKSYSSVEKTPQNGLTTFETDFIRERDSFYMASIGSGGFPYIQHRGGPKGFLNVIDAQTLVFIDFSGNRQFITVGNISTNNNVSIIMMDYRARARLKIYARAEEIALDERPDLMSLLSRNEYPAKAERIILLRVEAFDWNCPQHITPRYTAEEIDAALEPQREYIKKLEQELNAKVGLV